MCKGNHGGKEQTSGDLMNSSPPAKVCPLNEATVRFWRDPKLQENFQATLGLSRLPLIMMGKFGTPIPAPG